MSEEKQETANEEAEKPLENYVEILNSFIVKCNAYSNYCSSALKTAKNDLDESRATLKEYSENFGNEEFKIDMALILRSIKEFDERMETYKLILESVLLMLVANFDSFFSRLLTEIILEKEDIQKGIHKEISFKEVANCKNLDEVKEMFVNSFINSKMRDSHNEQIEWLEKLFGLNIIKEFKGYKDFIFLTEVRNIIAHNGSIIDAPFINNLNKHKISKAIIDKLEVKNTFDLTPKYLYDSINLIIHFAIFLYIRILRNTYREFKDTVDDHINRVSFDYLQGKRYNLVISILEERLNATDKYMSETKYFYLVNLCIAYDRIGDKQKMIEILDKEDWSNCMDKFKLAKAVLENNDDKFAYYVKKIHNEITEAQYREWPLFEEVKKKEIFKRVFKEVFGKDFEDNLEEDKIAEMFKASEKIEQEVSDSLESEKLVAKATLAINKEE